MLENNVGLTETVYFVVKLHKMSFTVRLVQFTPFCLFS
ncbi:MAG: hypothetical protein UU98_C0012G0009 [Parcubacteria group bacterium GW2011_GWD2_42_14]|nr:MAG: hypothetical protein UU98_C0012G0009 [Parcubacteria group bacterium GW2011_GWD2_42_14]